jgi:hypothetical protein
MNLAVTAAQEGIGMVAWHRSHALSVALLAALGWVGGSAHGGPVTTEDLLKA